MYDAVTSGRIGVPVDSLCVVLCKCMRDGQICGGGGFVVVWLLRGTENGMDMGDGGTNVKR